MSLLDLHRHPAHSVAAPASSGRADRYLDRLRVYIAEFNIGIDARLPPERHLCNTLGLTRAQLRTALAKLEAEGLIWRHVGKGTFIGSKPIAEYADITAIVEMTNAVEVKQVRQLFEPEIAALAAARATSADLDEMHNCLARARAAACKREYDAWDSKLHRSIAAASHNSVVLFLMDVVSAIRRAQRWGRVQDGDPPPPSHHSFADHQAIVDAIESHDAVSAREKMRWHLSDR